MNPKPNADRETNENLNALLTAFLESVCRPAFCALPKSEIELQILTLLEGVGTVSRNADSYELVSKLKVTSNKARKLIYERELRRLSAQDLDGRVKDLLKRPIIQKSGETFILDVENPLVSDHLRAKVRGLGFVTDGSFSPSVVKLPLAAIVALMDAYIEEHEKPRIQRVLVAAGAPDSSFKGVLKAVVYKIAQRVAAETGEAMMDRAAEYLGPILDAANNDLIRKVSDVFSPAGSKLD